MSYSNQQHYPQNNFEIFGQGYHNLSGGDPEFATNFDDLCFSANGGARGGAKSRSRGASRRKSKGGYARLAKSKTPWFRHIYKCIKRNSSKYLLPDGRINLRACKEGYARSKKKTMSTKKYN